MWRPALAIVLVLALAPQAAGAQESVRFVGRPLAEVLSDLQAEGLQIVFSTAVVTPTMVVEAEPSANDPRRILDQILAPHGLTAEEGPGGTVFIVVATPVGEGSPVAGEVHGLVTVSGNPIEAPDMMIVVEDTPIEVAPAPDGSFVIPDLPAGRYTVTVTSTSSMLWVMNADELTDHRGRSGRYRGDHDPQRVHARRPHVTAVSATV